ncbi:MAG TPA: GNAT family N-acetyltransferase [Rhodopila sp.]|nr:GNAT family N-acetyltransferase [Rhodopila sp.]
MIRVVVRSDVDFAQLGQRWRDLEARSACSFFLSWTWIGCLIDERFPNPLLVEAIEDGRTVALALFNRTWRWGMPVLWLHESGSPALDCPWIEQNGVLAEAGREAELTRLCLGAVLGRARVTLSGIDATTQAAVQALAGIVRVVRAQESPFADLSGLRAAGASYFTSRSANTRQQLARSVRWYAAEAGGGQSEPAVEEAATVEAACGMLDLLAELHTARWVGRGGAGSFAQPFFRRFHRTLIERGMGRGEIALQRISFSGIIVGYLYNFRLQNKMLAYQSGLYYREDASMARPGLVAHATAIQQAMAHNIDIYDFLAGDDRYKRSLSDSEHRIWWLEAGPVWSLSMRLRQWGGALKTAWRRGAKCRNSLQVPLKFHKG